jgi:F-type H+-transporting ATPase subunit b
MRRRIRPTVLLFAAALLALGVLLYANRSPAQGQQPQPRPPLTGAAQRAQGRPKAPNARGAPAPVKKAGTHGHGADSPSSHAAHDENGPPPPINWWHGLLGTKDGVHPGLLWRGPEEPPPFLASVINFGALVFILVYFGKKPLAAALAKRKESIMREIDEAQRMRDAAESRLKEHEAKLERMGEEIERLRREIREQGEHDKARIIAEANERRERMKADAQLLLAHELEELRRGLMKEAVDEASRIATELLAQRMTLADHERFVDAFFAELHTSRDRGVSAGGPS